MILRILYTILSVILIAFFVGCSDTTPIENIEEFGFNPDNSDPKAIEIADKVINAMGGQENWENTRYITWEFFGARKLFWDKKTGNVRVFSARDNFTILVNIHDLTGRVLQNGQEITQPDTLKKFLEIGKSMWINDSYWLVMPFKLKDPGVNLKYLRQDTTSEGKLAEVIELTFDGVGETPDNKYEVYVDKETNLVSDWAYFRNAKDEIPKFKNPWRHYKKHGNILLSFDRGNGQFLTGIEVLDELPIEIFTEF